MNLEEQINLYKELAQKIEELEQQKKLLSLAIREQMREKTINVANYIVRRYSRLSIKLTLEKARLIDAVKMAEIIDKDKIKKLVLQGQFIEGVSEIEYIQVYTNKTPI